MRLTTWASALAVAAVARADLAPRFAPIDVASTQVQLDRSREALDNGAITFSVLRRDDLVDDDSHTLLAERLSHVAVKIQLDQSNAGIRVNDELIPLDGNVDDVAITVVKSDALLISPEMAMQTLVSAEEMGNAIEHMSTGIVSLEVRVESEMLEAGAAMGAGDDGEMRAMIVDGLRLRRIGVFVKINEVEGVDVAHSSLVYAPILQLLVSSDTADGDRITKVTTLSVGGQLPIDDAPVMPGIALSESLPALEPTEEAAEPSEEHWRPHPHHRGGFFGWLANAFGLRPPRRHDAPCPQRFRKGLAANPNPYAVVNEDGILAVMPNGPGSVGPEDTPPAEDSSRSHHRHGHGHGHRHGRHGRRRGMCFFRRFVSGIHFVMATIWTSLAGQIALGMLAGGALFSAVRRIVHRRRARYTPLDAAFDRDDFEKKDIADTVFLAPADELPEYTQVAIIVTEPHDEKH